MTSRKKTKTEPVKTVLVITVGMLAVHLTTQWNWVLYASLVIGVLGVFSNYLAQKIDNIWTKLSRVLSLIVPNILLTILFYFILTPIALLSRIFGEKNQLSIKNTAPTLFKAYHRQFDKAFFEKTW